MSQTNDKLPAGTLVFLCELKNCSELNGERACIVDWDNSALRYTIVTLDSNKRYRVKPDNVTKCVDDISSAFASVMASAVRSVTLKRPS